MTNILYGVCGDGLGHASRAKEIIVHLQGGGHKIKIVSSSRGLINLRNFFDVEEIFAPKLVYIRNKVNYLKTFWNNLIGIPSFFRSIERVLKIIDQEKINVVFTDFDPISCIAANLKRIPLISIDNQHAFTHTDIAHPGHLSFLFFRFLNKFFIFNVKNYLVINFFKANPNKKEVNSFSPILRREILNIKPTQGDYMLVYFTSGLTNLANCLKNINEKFIYYGTGEERSSGNVFFKKASPENFLEDLAGCKAIIGNSGFSLVSEALYLGKPFLTYPVENQPEQILSAYHLDRLGYGKYAKKIDEQEIRSFISNLNIYKENLKTYCRCDNSKIFHKIDELITQYQN